MTPPPRFRVIWMSVQCGSDHSSSLLDITIGHEGSAGTSSLAGLAVGRIAYHGNELGTTGVGTWLGCGVALVLAPEPLLAVKNVPLLTNHIYRQQHQHRRGMANIGTS
jgi:hypothetical protein